jgi:hypothetical protein
VAEPAEVVAGKERELLEEDRALAPGRAFEDVEAAIPEGGRRLDRRLVGGKVGAFERGGMLAGGCRSGTSWPDEPLDLVGDPPAVEDVEARLQRRDAALAAVLDRRVEQVRIACDQAGNRTILPTSGMPPSRKTSAVDGQCEIRWCDCSIPSRSAG